MEIAGELSRDIIREIFESTERNEEEKVNILRQKA
jgi:hypothetical protein